MQLIVDRARHTYISAFIIEEDKTIYSKYMNIMTVDVTYVSSIEIWNLYINDLSFAMEEHAQNKNCTTTGSYGEILDTIIKLVFRIHEFTVQSQMAFQRIRFKAARVRE